MAWHAEAPSSLVRLWAGVRQGAGVLLRRDLLLTAWHVVSRDGKPPGQTPDSGAPDPANELVIGRKAKTWKFSLTGSGSPGPSATVVFATRDTMSLQVDLDLALVRLSERLPIQPRTPPLAKGLAHAEFRVLKAGDPSTGHALRPLRAWGFPHGDDPVFKDLEAKDIDPEEWKEEFYFLKLRQGLLPGYSGGLLFFSLEGQPVWVGIASLSTPTLPFSAHPMARGIRAFLAAQKVAVKTIDVRRELLRPELERIERRCRKLSWHEKLSLERVHVPQLVLQRSASAVFADDPGPRDLGALLSSKAEGDLSSEPPPASSSAQTPRSRAPRWVVLSDPGGGKSTLLRHRAAELAHWHPARGTTSKRLVCGQGVRRAWGARLAIDLSFPALVRGLGPASTESGQEPWRVALLSEARKRAGLYVRELLRDGDPRGEIELLLDGFDERPAESNPSEHEEPDAAQELLDGIARHLPRTPVALCTRITGFDENDGAFEGWGLARIEKLKSGDRWRLFEKLLSALDGGEKVGRDELRKWSDGLEPDPRYAEACGNPLWVTLVARHVAKGGGLPDSRVELFHGIVDLLERDTAPRITGFREIVGALAYAMTVRGEDQTPLCALKRDLATFEVDRADLPLARGWMESLRKAFTPTGSDYYKAVLVELHRTRFLAPPLDGNEDDKDEQRDGTDEDQPWKFWHRSLQEYLTFEVLKAHWMHDTSLVREELEALLKAREENVSFWSEPFGMLAESLAEEGEHILISLADWAPDVARRVLVSARSATRGSIEAVLGGLTYDEERGSVIREIARLLGNPEAALELLESLGADPRIRADLYFIDEALVKLATKHAKIAKRAKKAQVEIYTKLVPKDALPVELFRWVHSDRAIPEDEDLRDLFDEQGRFSLWREIPAGSFDMGEGDKVSQETIEDAFWISAVTVTQEQFRVFDPSYGRDKGNTWTFQGDRLPTIGVSWYAAEGFARWYGYALGLDRPGHLPSERDWEYAARAGSKTRYWFGDNDDDLDGFGWHRGNSGGKVHEVATAPPSGEAWQVPNAWGLFDVHGNVPEWCAEPYEDGRGGRVVRGGSCWSAPANCRSAFRTRLLSWNRSRLRGFRVVLPAAPVFDD